MQNYQYGSGDCGCCDDGNCCERASLLFSSVNSASTAATSLLMMKSYFCAQEKVASELCC
jgi:hypothetical protein